MKKSWWQVLALMSSRNPASTPVISAAVVSTATASSAHSTNSGSTNGAGSLVTLLADPNYVCLRCNVLAHWRQASEWNGCQLHHAWCRSHFLLPRWYAVPFPADVAWPEENLGNSCLFSPSGASHLRYAARCLQPASTRLCLSPAAAPPQWPHHDPLDLWHQKPRQNFLSFTKLGFQGTAFLRSRWLRWYGHVQRTLSSIKCVSART